MPTTTNTDNKLFEVARRIKEMRSICDFSVEEMAEKTEVTPEQYLSFESGAEDLPFSFIHKCALAFDIGITDLLEGHSAKLTSYTVTRKGEGQTTAKENGIEIQNLAPLFKDKLADPYWVDTSIPQSLKISPCTQ
jgi:acetyl-CoA synthetase